MSRVARVWGMSESGLADLLGTRIVALDAMGAETPRLHSGHLGSKGDQGPHNREGR